MKYIKILIVLLLVGCVSTPTNPEFWMEQETNACLPTAIIFKQSLRKYGVWAEVFRYSWIGKQDHKYHGHAMVAYLYPPGKNQLWSYDAQGSYKIRAFTNNITQVAQEAHKIRGSTENIFNAEYIK